MPKQTIEELLENLIYDAVVEHREELENNQEWCRAKEEFENLVREIEENIDPLTSTVDAGEKMRKLITQLLDRHIYLAGICHLS